MLLSEILNNISLKTVSGKTDIPIGNLQFDSRRVDKESLFFAIPGTQVDGHSFISKVVTAGVRAIICETLPKQLQEKVSYIQVTSASEALGQAANNFYHRPSKRLKLVGVTGTNGKTSVATLLFQLFRKLGYQCGLLSTVANQIEDRVIPSTHTTPDPIKINELLTQMLEQGCSHVFMEVSSHAVSMHRIAGLYFTGGIFTNISQDHLDFHKTFDNYIKAKKGFFDQLQSSSFALTNTDDKNGKVMLQNSKAHKYSYSLKGIGDFKGKVLDYGLFGLQMDVNGTEVWFKLIGKFNAYNLLAVYGTAELLGEDPQEVLMQLSTLTPPAGRFEQIISKEGIVGIVDYAHTPDALKNVLETILDFHEQNRQIITVIGCGGDRDKGKRPLMAKIAVELSTKVIMTSDNPRSENPNAILKEMQEGVSITKKRKVLTIENRMEAIRTAVMLSQPGDIVLVAGKGHEDYQEIKGIKYPFDDKQELKKAFDMT